MWRIHGRDTKLGVPWGVYNQETKDLIFFLHGTLYSIFSEEFKFWSKKIMPWFKKKSIFLTPWGQEIFKFFVSWDIMGHLILYPSHEFFITGITIKDIHADSSIMQRQCVLSITSTFCKVSYWYTFSFPFQLSLHRQMTGKIIDQQLILGTLLMGLT